MRQKCACKGFFLDRLIQPAVLLFLSREDLHGFSLLKKLAESDFMDREGVDPTGLYRTLRKMEKDGLLTSRWDHAASPPKRVYVLTGEGRECLANWRATLLRYRGNIDRLTRAIAEGCERT